MTIGFNIGAINLGDCSLALDFLNNSEDYEPEITEVRQDILGKAPLVHDRTVSKPKITKTSLVHKYAIVRNTEEQDTILNESLMAGQTGIEEDIDISMDDDYEVSASVEKMNTLIEQNKIGYEDETEDTETEEESINKAMEDFDFDDFDTDEEEEQEEKPVETKPVISIQEQETEDYENQEQNMIDSLFDEDEEEQEQEEQEQEEEVIEPVIQKIVAQPKVSQTATQNVPAQPKVEVQERISNVVKEVEVEQLQELEETEEEIKLRKQLEEIQERKRAKAHAQMLEKQRRIEELKAQLEREKEELESTDETERTPVERVNHITVPNNTQDKRTANEKRYMQYAEMEIDALYIEVKRFLQQNGVEKGMVASSKVVAEFGDDNVRRLKKKSYIITIGKGVTIGR